MEGTALFVIGGILAAYGLLNQLRMRRSDARLGLASAAAIRGTRQTDAKRARPVSGYYRAVNWVLVVAGFVLIGAAIFIP